MSRAALSSPHDAHRHIGVLPAYAFYGGPAVSPDTTATAIAAAALALLAAAEPDTDRGRRHRDQAEAAVDALLPHVTAAGGLAHGCYHRTRGLAVDRELVWGDFHLLEALLTLEGRDPLSGSPSTIVA